MKLVSYFAGLALAMLAMAPPVGWIVPGARADDEVFSQADVDGGYGFSFDGGVLVKDGQQLLLVSAVGQINANKGEVTKLSRTLSLGGLSIVKDVFEGTADVNEDGTGTAIFCTTSRTGNGTLYPDFTEETFEFVITGEDNEEIEFIGTKVMPVLNEFCDPLEGAQLIPASVRGVARKQGKGGGDDD